MTELDALPADQRAAVQLLVKQGQSYEQLADLLGIDPEGVRTRAHAALGALAGGAGAGLDDESRAEVADYLLGQQSVSQREATRALLGSSPAARAWAQGVAGTLEPLAGDALPEIPGAAPEPAPATYERAPFEEAEAPAEEEAAPREDALTRDEPSPREEFLTRDEPSPREEPPTREEEPAGFDDDEPAAFDFPPREGREGRERRRRGAATTTPERSRDRGTTGAPSSRLGGALLLAGIGIVLAVAIVLIISGGGDDGENGNTVSRTAPTQTGTTQQRPIAQINLFSASGNSRQVGLAQVFEQGNRRALIVAGQGLRPGAYALWLYNSDSDARLLGFVPERVGEDGRFATQGELPRNAENFEKLVVTRERVTRETREPPDEPGRIVLQGDIELPDN